MDYGIFGMLYAKSRNDAGNPCNQEIIERKRTPERIVFVRQTLRELQFCLFLIVYLVSISMISLLREMNLVIASGANGLWLNIARS